MDRDIKLSALYEETEEREKWGVCHIQAFVDATKQRASFDLVVCIDCSGSMSGNPLQLVKKTLSFIAGQLSSTDRLALVTYANSAEVKLPLTYMSAAGRQHALAVIDALFANGNTNLADGLLEGMKLIAARVPPMNSVASVLLLTDGEANAGITSPDDIVNAMAEVKCASADAADSASEQSEALAKMTVYTFGYGSAPNANLLKAISDKGHGVYYFIEDEENVPKCFGDCVGGLLSVVAQTIMLELKPLNGVVLTKIWDKRADVCGNIADGATFDLGDLQSEEERDIVFQFTMPAVAPAQSGWALLKCTLSYFNVIDMKASSVACTMMVEDHVRGNSLVDTQRNRVLAVAAFAEAQRRIDAADPAGAMQVLQTSISNIDMTPSVADASVQLLRADMFMYMNTIQARAEPRGASSTRTRLLQSHEAQRSNTSAPSAYSTTSRLTFMSNMNP